MAPNTVIEEGNVYFFYRPKVEVHHVYGREDVQRMLMILAPYDHRLLREVVDSILQRLSNKIVIGKKHMPEYSELSLRKNWAFVSKVVSDPLELQDSLSTESHETKTLGTRVTEAPRPAGKGVYSITMHKTHAHLCYILEVPKQVGEVQDDLGIKREGNFIIQIKNPAKAAKGVGLGKDSAEFPEHLCKKFGNSRLLH